MSQSGLDIRRVAGLQRWLALYFILLLLVTMACVIVLVLPGGMDSLGFVVLGLVLVQLPAIALVVPSVLALRNKPALVVMCAAMFVPLMGLYALGYLLSESMRIVRTAGITPPLFGLSKTRRDALPADASGLPAMPPDVNPRAVRAALPLMFWALPVMLSFFPVMKYLKKREWMQAVIDMLPEVAGGPVVWFILVLGVLGVMAQVALCRALRMHPLITAVNAVVTMFPYMNLGAALGTYTIATRVLKALPEDDADEAAVTDSAPRADGPPPGSGWLGAILFGGSVVGSVAVVMIGLGILTRERPASLPVKEVSETVDPAPESSPEPNADPLTYDELIDRVQGREAARVAETDRRAAEGERQMFLLTNSSPAEGVPFSALNDPPQMRVIWARMQDGEGRIVRVDDAAQAQIVEKNGFTTWSANLGLESEWTRFSACVQIADKYFYTETPKGSSFWALCAADNLAPDGPSLTPSEHTTWSSTQGVPFVDEILWARFGRGNNFLVATDEVKAMWSQEGHLVADRPRLGLEDPARGRTKDLRVLYSLDGYTFRANLVRGAKLFIEDSPRPAP